jgi:hypothetical protein
MKVYYFKDSHIQSGKKMFLTGHILDDFLNQFLKDEKRKLSIEISHKVFKGSSIAKNIKLQLDSVGDNVNFETTKQKFYICERRLIDIFGKVPKMIFYKIL